jgi:hypothetical protein
MNRGFEKAAIGVNLLSIAEVDKPKFGALRELQEL